MLWLRIITFVHYVTFVFYVTFVGYATFVANATFVGISITILNVVKFRVYYIYILLKTMNGLFAL